ncbi:reverse transcriptase domain-containing protein [Tanacetum coccineum]
MVTPADKRSSNKFCEFHNDKGHSTDECMQLKKQIEELVKAGKLSHFIKEIREDRDKLKNRKKEAPAKEKAAAIYMIQPWHRVTRQKVTLSFAQKNEITFPPLSANKGTEGQRDKSQMVLPNHSLTASAGESYMAAGAIKTVVGGMGSEKSKARVGSGLPSTAHGMLKFPVDGGVVTIRSTILMPNECAAITKTSKDSMKKIEGRQENVKVAIHHDFPDQEGYYDRQPNTDSISRTDILRSDKKRGARLRNEPRPSRQSWRVCVDFTNLNKACPQDCYPLPEIDWKVESLCSYPFKCFLNAYKGYHQIQMAEKDEEKTAFHTPHGVYCYTKMPFGLKNAGAAAAVVCVCDPCRPLFKTLKKCVKKSDFRWTPEAEQAFKQLKQHISELPMLVAPRPKEELIMYLSASQGAVGAVLMTERDSIQTPVYFVSRALQGPELNYTPMEKLVLALVFAAKRLRSIMLGEHNITYRPRTSVKGQILADFLVEKPEEASADMSEKEEFRKKPCLEGGRVSPTRKVSSSLLSNKEAVIGEGLLVGCGTYIAKEENMIKYLEKVKSLVSDFASFSISQVPRSHNKNRIAQSNIASNSLHILSINGHGRGSPRKCPSKSDEVVAVSRRRRANLDNTHNRVPERWGPPGRQEGG